ncbi:MAG: fibronectin type III domain-containing protein, partial [Actinobacteria bacterium]|nr:fibronectin type III domain-containing protein [Actinomycetota bacterium]
FDTDVNGNADVVFFQRDVDTTYSLRAVDRNNAARGVLSDVNLSSDGLVTIVMPDPITISGQIVTATGTPLPNLPLTWWGSKRTTTGSDGTFTFTDVTPGDMFISVGNQPWVFAPCPNLIPYCFAGGARFLQMTSLSGLLITLPPTITKHVHVVDGNGLPIANVRIEMDNSSGSTAYSTAYTLSDNTTRLGGNVGFNEANFFFDIFDTDVNGNADVVFFQRDVDTTYSLRAVDRNNAARGVLSDVNLSSDGPVTIVMPSVPLPPASLSANSGATNTDINVAWGAPSSDGGSPIKEYVVTATPDGAIAHAKRPGMTANSNPSSLTVFVRANARSITLRGAVPGQSYIVTVAASNVVGRGKPAQTRLLKPQPALKISNSKLSGVAGTAVKLTATGGTGSGSLSFSVSGANCTLSGSSLNATGLAQCVVTATKAASASYGPAVSPTVKFTFTLATQAALKVSNSVKKGTVGAAVKLTASGGSGSGSLSFSVTGSGCAISGQLLTTTKAGNCSVKATKAANGIYAVAVSPVVVFAFTVKK